MNEPVEPTRVSFSFWHTLPADLQFAQVVVSAGQYFKLTKKEFEDVLNYLVERNRTDSRDARLDEIDRL